MPVLCKTWYTLLLCIIYSINCVSSDWGFVEWLVGDDYDNESSPTTTQIPLQTIDETIILDNDQVPTLPTFLKSTEFRIESNTTNALNNNNNSHNNEELNPNLLLVKELDNSIASIKLYLDNNKTNVLLNATEQSIIFPQHSQQQSKVDKTWQTVVNSSGDNESIRKTIIKKCNNLLINDTTSKTAIDSPNNKTAKLNNSLQCLIPHNETLVQSLSSKSLNETLVRKILNATDVTNNNSKPEESVGDTIDLRLTTNLTQFSVSLSNHTTDLKHTSLKVSEYFNETKNLLSSRNESIVCDKTNTSQEKDNSNKTRIDNHLNSNRTLNLSENWSGNETDYPNSNETNILKKIKTKFQDLDLNQDLMLMQIKKFYKKQISEKNKNSSETNCTQTDEQNTINKHKENLKNASNEVSMVNISSSDDKNRLINSTLIEKNNNTIIENNSKLLFNDNNMSLDEIEFYIINQKTIESKLVNNTSPIINLNGNQTEDYCKNNSQQILNTVIPKNNNVSRTALKLTTGFNNTREKNESLNAAQHSNITNVVKNFTLTLDEKETDVQNKCQNKSDSNNTEESNELKEKLAILSQNHSEVTNQTEKLLKLSYSSFVLTTIINNFQNSTTESSVQLNLTRDLNNFTSSFTESDSENNSHNLKSNCSNNAKEANDLREKYVDKLLTTNDTQFHLNVSNKSEVKLNKQNYRLDETTSKQIIKKFTEQPLFNSIITTSSGNDSAKNSTHDYTTISPNQTTVRYKEKSDNNESFTIGIKIDESNYSTLSSHNNDSRIVLATTSDYIVRNTTSSGVEDSYNFIKDHSRKRSKKKRKSKKKKKRPQNTPLNDRYANLYNSSVINEQQEQEQQQQLKLSTNTNESANKTEILIQQSVNNTSLSVNDPNLSNDGNDKSKVKSKKNKKKKKKKPKIMRFLTRHKEEKHAIKTNDNNPNNIQISENTTTNNEPNITTVSPVITTTAELNNSLQCLIPHNETQLQSLSLKSLNETLVRDILNASHVSNNISKPEELVGNATLIEYDSRLTANLKQCNASLLNQTTDLGNNNSSKFSTTKTHRNETIKTNNNSIQITENTTNIELNITTVSPVVTITTAELNNSLQRLMTHNETQVQSLSSKSMNETLVRDILNASDVSHNISKSKESGSNATLIEYDSATANLKQCKISSSNQTTDLDNNSTKFSETEPHKNESIVGDKTNTSKEREDNSNQTRIDSEFNSNRTQNPSESESEYPNSNETSILKQIKTKFHDLLQKQIKKFVRNQISGQNKNSNETNCLQTDEQNKINKQVHNKTNKLLSLLSLPEDNKRGFKAMKFNARTPIRFAKFKKLVSKAAEKKDHSNTPSDTWSAFDIPSLF